MILIWDFLIESYLSRIHFQEEKNHPSYLLNLQKLPLLEFHRTKKMNVKLKKKIYWRTIQVWRKQFNTSSDLLMWRKEIDFTVQLTKEEKNEEGRQVFSRANNQFSPNTYVLAEICWRDLRVKKSRKLNSSLASPSLPITNATCDSNSISRLSLPSPFRSEG